MGALQFFLLCLTPALLAAVKINAKGREVIYLAKGDSAKLGCPYELEPQDHGPNGLDIEWTQMNSDPTSLDSVILSYHDHQVIHPGYQYLQPRGGSVSQDLQNFGNPGLQQNVLMGGSSERHLGPVQDCCHGLQQRVTFALQDPSQYDASINLQDVQMTDSATYECKVKKTTVATRKVTVKVLERPSTPQCSIMGKRALGAEITLSCTAHTGTAPVMYQWTKVADHNSGSWLPPAAIKGPNPGDLTIHSLSHEHVGIYQCSVANKVGSARCILEISLSEDFSLTGIIIGGVLGSLLLLLLLLGLILGLIYCCKKEQSKQESNQIRVEPAPPRPSGGSRSSSLRSVLGYIPHNISFMQRRKYESPKEQEVIEMISPAQEAELVESCSTTDSPTVVTSKARVHCAPSWSSPAPSPQSRVSRNQGGNSTSNCDQEAGQTKRGHPGQYGGVPVMVPAQSREGLLV